LNPAGESPILQRHFKREALFLFNLVIVCFLLAFLPSQSRAAQGVLLDWSPSPDGRVIGYNVYYGLATGGFSQKMPVGNISSVDISGLAAGETYHFTVTARDADGYESPPAETVSFVVPQLQPVTLTMQIYVDESEKPFAMGIEGNTDSASVWQLDYSLDLRTWSPYSNGTGANAFALVPFGGGGQPQMFFRMQAY